MAKYCIILPCNIYVAPFYYRYEAILSSLKLDFDVILWNRSNVTENSEGNLITYNNYIKSNDGNKLKIIDFIKFARFVKKNIKKNNYQKIIFLSSYSATVALLSNWISKKYKKKYWIDIRDYTYEYSHLYRKLISNAIMNSSSTAISSPGFKEFLPRYNYIPVHNYNKTSELLQLQNEYLYKRKQDPIKISFIGNVRYYEQNVNILELFKNDMRFQLQYFGDGIDELVQYCKTNSINNVKFRGRFKPEETMDLYKDTDIINNCYGNTDFALRTSISNKYYYSLNLIMPILVSEGTYMEQLTLKSGLGFTLKFEQGITDMLYEWYNKLDLKTYKDNIDLILSKIEKENFEFDNLLRKFVMDI